MLLHALVDWRFPFAVLFLGNLFATLLYWLNPVKNPQGEGFRDLMAQRIMMMELDMESAFKDKTVLELAYYDSLGRAKQFRRMLAYGLLLAFGVASVSFIYLPFRAIAGWLYVTLGAVSMIIAFWRASAMSKPKA